MDNKMRDIFLDIQKNAEPLKIVNQIRASRILALCEAGLLQNKQMQIEAYALYTRIQFLIDTVVPLDEEGCFTFPNGETWQRTQPNPPAPRDADVGGGPAPAESNVSLPADGGDGGALN